MAVPPPYLAMKYRSAAGFEEVLLCENGLDVSTLGSALADTATGKNPVNAMGRSYCRKYAGQIFAFGSINVFSKDDPTARAGGYTSVLALSIPSTTEEMSWSGLHPVAVGGEPRLVGFYYTTTANVYHAVIFNPLTSVWSLGAATNLGNSMTEMRDARVHNNLLYVTGSSATSPRTIVYAPGTDTYVLSTTSPGTANDFGGSMFVHKNKLYGLGQLANSFHVLKEFVGGVWTVVKTFTTICPTGLGGTQAIGPSAAESIGGEIICLMLSEDAGGDGLKAFSLNDALTETDISVPFVPVALRTNADGGPGIQATTSRVSWLTDMVTDPTTPRYWVQFTGNNSDEGETPTLYSFLNKTTELFPEDSGGNAWVVFPGQGAFHGGSHYWSDAGWGFGDCLITGNAAIADGARLSFRGWNDSGSADKTARIFFSLTGDAALSQAVLKGTATGGTATRVANTVENIDADGITTYTLDVSYSGSGITPGGRVQFYLQLEDTTP